MSEPQTIYLSGLSFDYAHMIPSHPKCGRLHGHTSQVRAAVTGRPDTLGMVIDFAVLRRVLESVIDACDHRLLVNRSSLKAEDAERVCLEYNRDGAANRLDLARSEVVLLDSEPTVEAISTYLLAQLADAFEARGICFDRIEIECTEGTGKGAIATRTVQP